MGESSRYASPEAARRAVTDKLKIQAPHSPWALADLQRQYAYDQLIERLYRVDGGWVIKGATALLARRVSVRHTTDLDVYRAGAIAETERLLREAAALDIGDWMTFEIGAAVQIHASGAQAARAKVETFIGVRLWSAFQVDLVAEGIELTGHPDPVHPLTDIEILAFPRRPGRPTHSSTILPTRSVPSSSDIKPCRPRATRTSSTSSPSCITLLWRRRCRGKRWSRKAAGAG